MDVEADDRASDNDSNASYDSIFDDDDAAAAATELDPPNEVPIALDVAPPIPGLYFDPSVRIPQEVADMVVKFCMEMYFVGPKANQVMLFGRSPQAEEASDNDEAEGLPPVLRSLLETLASTMRPVLPDATFDLLFPSEPTQARQAIINLYQPGEGITPHVDLLARYGDGIIGVSFGSGCVMRFDKNDEPEGEEELRWDVYVPERSIIVLSEEARYGWTHGIDKRTQDYVCDTADGGRWIERGVRVSITFRWMLEGADVLS